MAGGPPPGQGQIDRAACLDLSGHKAERTVSHLRHGDTGGLCRRPAGRIVQPAGRRRAISVPGRVRKAGWAQDEQGGRSGSRGTRQKTTAEKATEDQKELLAKRQANTAVALLKLGRPENVWPLLKFSPDPRVRSYVIHWLSPLGVDPQAIVKRFDTESDVTIRRALVLMLGEFSESQLSMAQRQPLIEKLLVIYENQPDAGLHGAAEWLLRKWEQGKRLEAVVEKLKSDDKQLQARKSSDKRQWYVNTQKQTFVIVDAGEFLMGSPESEPGR